MHQHDQPAVNGRLDEQATAERTTPTAVQFPAAEQPGPTAEQAAPNGATNGNGDHAAPPNGHPYPPQGYTPGVANGQPTASWGAPSPPPGGWGQPGPDGYAQYHQPPAPGYGPPAYGPPPVQPPAPTQPQGGGGGQRGLIITLAGLIAALLLGAAVAVIMLVSSSDKSAKTADPATATAAAAQRTVTTVIRETTVPAKPTSSTRPSSRSSRSTRSISGQASRPTARRRSTPAAAPASSASTDRAEISSMLRRHFANIQARSYTAAFADLAASLGQSQSSWISDIRADGLYSFDLSIAPQLTSSTSGVANIINFHTEANASGCKDWSGSWNVVKSGGRWLISKSNLSQTVVSCGE